MSVGRRVQTCRLLEKMRSQEGYSKKLGLENVSTFRGRKLNKVLEIGREKKGD